MEGPYNGFLLHSGDISYADGAGWQWEQFMTLLQPFATRIPYLIGFAKLFHLFNHFAHLFFFLFRIISQHGQSRFVRWLLFMLTVFQRTSIYIFAQINLWFHGDRLLIRDVQTTTMSLAMWTMTQATLAIHHSSRPGVTSTRYYSNKYLAVATMPSKTIIIVR